MMSDDQWSRSDGRCQVCMMLYSVIGCVLLAVEFGSKEIIPRERNIACLCCSTSYVSALIAQRCVVLTRWASQTDFYSGTA